MNRPARFLESARQRNDRIDLFVTGIGQLCTVDGGEADAQHPRRRGDLRDAGIVNEGALAIGDGKILAAGPEAELRQVLFGDRTVPDGVEFLDVGGRAVVPGFVDPHTHTVFGRFRQDEYERRILGETYLEIAASGGGIHASVADLRSRPSDELTELAAGRLRRMLSSGTTTVEIKSGYGLDEENEIRMLEIARDAAAVAGIRSIRTCLAAHEMPPEYRDRRGEYVRLITERILVRAAAEDLAQRCDVFCEPSVFGLEETLVILTRARDLGLGLTVHADELESFGGAVLAARLGADSADHLIRIDEEGRRALAGSSTVAVMLPGTVFTLGLKEYAPARKMIDQGCALALASDFNPGSCPILSMPLIMAIACTQMRLTPSEALVAATLNSAWALRMQESVGSLAPGKNADFLVLDGPDFRLIPYRAGHNPVEAVFLGGQKINA